MKLDFSFQKVLGVLDHPEVIGDPPEKITGIESLKDAKEGDLSFISDKKYRKQLDETSASVILIPELNDFNLRSDKVYLRVKDTSLALSLVCEAIEKELIPPVSGGIHSTAIVDSTVKVSASASVGAYVVIEAGASIGERVQIMPHSYVGRNVILGDDTKLHPRVTVLDNITIGKRCTLFSGAVIGGEGFGFKSSAEGHRRLAQIGSVVLEDDVEVGCNSTIDRARFAETRIGRGTKIDNLVQVGHNVIVGEHCILCSQVGISGSTELGKFVTLAGQVGVSGHIYIGDGAIALGQAGLTRDIAPKQMVAGTPARPHQQQRRAEAIALKLPEILTRLKAIEKDLEKGKD